MAPLAFGFLAAAALLVAAAPSLHAAPLAMVEVAPGLYVHQGVHTEASAENEDAIANIGFIVGDDAVMVVDPGGSPGEGEALREALRRVTALPIRFVVLSHVHPDHIFGASAFRGDHPEIVGHVRLPGALAQRGDYYLKTLQRSLGTAAEGAEIVAPTHLVATTEDIDLGNRPVEIAAQGPAHTDTDLALFDRRSGTLWLADLLFVDRVPSLDGSVVGWLSALDALMARPAQRAIPGHGPVAVPWPDGARDEYRYLAALRDGTRAAIAGGIDIADAPARVAAEERGRWLLFDQYHPRNVTAAFKELEWE